MLLLRVIDFNLSFVPSVHQLHNRVADIAMVGFSLTALAAWRMREALPLSQAKKQLMNINPSAAEEARKKEFEGATLTVGWSYFVQGGLMAWLLAPVLNFALVVLLAGVALAWLVLDSFDLAPFSAELLIARMLGLLLSKTQ